MTSRNASQEPESPESLAAGESALLSLLRDHSLACFAREARVEGASILESPPAGPVHGQWLGVILLAGPVLRVTLKIFFRASTVAQFLAPRAHVAPGEVAPSLIEDFVREFGNLYAGGVKRVLGGAGMPLGLSLPLVTRGFDEVFNGTGARRAEIVDAWRIGGADGKPLLVIAVSVAVLDARALAAFRYVGSDEREPDRPEDDMEFL